MARQKFYDTTIKPERAILVGIISPGESEEQTRETLDELKFLVDTAGGETVDVFTQRMQHPDRSTFVGTGKLEEIAAFVKTEGIDIVVFERMREGAVDEGRRRAGHAVAVTRDGRFRDA